MIIEHKETRTVTKTEEVVTSWYGYCNKCGEEFKKIVNGDKSYDEQLVNAKLINFGCSFGYGSRFDMDSWNFDLCENCLVDLVRTFKYAPQGFMEDDYTMTLDKHQKVFENWKETSKWEPLKYDTYEELFKYQGYFSNDYINKYIKLNYPEKDLL